MTYEEIKEKRDAAKAKFYKLKDEIDSNWDYYKSFNEYQRAVYETAEYSEYYKWEVQERLNRKPALRIADEWDLECQYKLSEFLELVKCGAITDYDGNGYYGNETEVSDVFIDIDQMREGSYRTDFSHVFWYNK